MTARAARVPRVTWEQALAWRMRRQLLDPVAGRSVADVVRRLCGIQAQAASSAELGVRKEAGAVPRTAIQSEAARLSTILERKLRLEVSLA